MEAEVELLLQNIPDDTKPQNPKELVLWLLNAIKSNDSSKKIAQIEELSLERIEELNRLLEENREKTDSLLKENEGLQEKNQGLQQEIDEKTILLEGVAVQENYHKEREKRLEEYMQLSSDREYQINVLNEEKAKVNHRLAELLEDFEKYKLKAPLLGTNEAVVSFTPDEKERFIKSRLALEAMGHIFTSNNPNEVIHAVVEHHMQVIKNLISISEAYAPVSEIINN